MLKKLLTFLNILIPLCFHNTSLFAQNDSLSTDSLSTDYLLKLRIQDMYERVNEDLLNQKVTIASKRSESLFDAPFSASVLTKEEISKAGCTTLMEALRLMPGLIVSEQSNGNYDIHIRGGSNIQRNTIFSISANTTTLVMIDNRPIYNYYLGGTFWESIPIDLNDIERIELVRGPTSAMYGPNAVSGVINIITRQTEEEGLHAVVNAQQGNNNTFINNAALGYQFGKKLSFIFSGNYQHRDRSQLAYYNYPLDSAVTRDAFVEIIPLGNAYPHPELSMEKYGINAFLNYIPIRNVKLDINAGLQNSEVQKAYSENFATPLTTALSKSRYIDLIAGISKFTAQFSYLTGTQEEGLGSLGQKWDFKTIDALLEYDISFKNLSIKPGINYRTATYDDTPYYNIANKEGQFNGKREIKTLAPYLRLDYLLLNNKLRLIAALRRDQFNFPEKGYFSYQFASTYKFNEKHLVRFVYSKANRSANIIFTYADRFLTNPPPTPPLAVAGNTNLELLTTNMLEFCYRSKINDNFQIDLEVYNSQSENYADFLNTALITQDVNGVPTLVQPFRSLNLPLKASQIGATLSLNYVYNRFQIRPFISFQKTTLSNASIYTNTADAPPTMANPNPSQNNIDTNIGKKEEHKGDPQLYGGAFINFHISRFNFNLNPYFFTSQTFYSYQNTVYTDGRGIGTVDTKLLLNIKVSFEILRKTSLFLSARNLLNNKSNEFFNTDAIGISVFGGLSFEY